jgi:Cu/Ag efflux protein CusF
MVRIPKCFALLLVFVFVLALAAPALAEEAKGKIKSIDADKNQFVLTDANGKDWTIHMSETAKVRLNDKDSKLNNLKEADEVTVTYDKKDDRLVATEIRCDRK